MGGLGELQFPFSGVELAKSIWVCDTVAPSPIVRPGTSAVDAAADCSGGTKETNQELRSHSKRVVDCGKLTTGKATLRQSTSARPFQPARPAQ